MPATFAAATRALAAAADASPDFAPRTLLDVGGGSGAVAWAARAVWPSIETIAITDREPAMLELGRQLAAGSEDQVLLSATWTRRAAGEPIEPADLVTAGYLLGELDEDERGRVVGQLWAATSGLLVVVEPGSRAGFGRVLDARSRLIAGGAHVVAPCPGPEPCPVAASRIAWCHFLARLDRSRLHRRAKAASRSWEDEPFSYIALSRAPGRPAARVVLGRPRHHPGRVELRICADGRIETRVVSRRAGDAWRIARDLAWGDAAPDPVRATPPSRDVPEPEASRGS
jgi:ribosomal protein RSM22 (predicted rRNA methylase)